MTQLRQKMLEELQRRGPRVRRCELRLFAKQLATEIFHHHWSER